jgi:hypothetical protein
MKYHKAIPRSRRISLVLPRSIPTGTAQLVVVVSSDTDAEEPGTRRADTGARLAVRALRGVWRNRADITPASLRKKAWSR